MDIKTTKKSQDADSIFLAPVPEVLVRDEIRKVYFFWEIIKTHFTAGRRYKSHTKRNGHIPEIEMAPMLTILFT